MTKTMEVHGVAIPAEWIICDECNGEGHNAKHLGAFTADEFNECFDTDEDRAAYFSGHYDQTCEACGGSGKVLIPVPALLTFTHKRALVEARREYRWRKADERAARLGY
jgi:hypothetical protein